MRYGAKVDANQAAIVEALRRLGCTVQSLASVGGGCPDLVVGVPEISFGTGYVVQSRNVLLEIKDGSKPPSARKLTPAEAKFHAEWRGEVYVVSSVSEALDVVMRRKGVA